MRTIPLSICLALLAVPAWAQGDYKEHPLTEHTFTEFEDGYRVDEIDIPLPAFSQLEYKLDMQKGDAIVYTWTAEGLDVPEYLTSEFHGHNDPTPDRPGDLMFYRKAQGDHESGAFVAPFDGVHGWYFLNESEQDIVVKLKVSGFHKIIDGQIPE